MFSVTFYSYALYAHVDKTINFTPNSMKASSFQNIVLKARAVIKLSHDSAIHSLIGSFHSERKCQGPK